MWSGVLAETGAGQTCSTVSRGSVTAGSVPMDGGIAAIALGREATLT